MSSKGSMLGAILLIAGTCIGAGMLALPVSTFPSGFFPSLILFLIAWAVMAAAGLGLLQLFLRFPKANNLLTLTEQILGKPARFIVWIVYILLFYSLLVAYSAAIGEHISTLTDYKLSITISSLCFMPLLGLAIYLGTHVVDRVNILFMLGLVISYSAFVILGIPHIDGDKLFFTNWNKFGVGFSIVLTSFGFQAIIPLLINHLERDVKQLRWAIIIGSLLPFFVYAAWQALILGVVPIEGEYSLTQARNLQQSALIPLQYQTGNVSVKLVGLYFACFAIATSFLGIGLAFVDFVADGLSIQPRGSNRLLLVLGILLPSLGFALWNPHIFYIALEKGAATCCIFLSIILPVWMFAKLQLTEK
ncbi:MAG: tyrP-C [Chlamydiales bacterium]|jgi:tyrosine-specific transport protein|nr:tyrP-C [Chlamydiales bacterium]